MIETEVAIDIADVERALDRVGRFGRDLTAIHKAMRRPLMHDQKLHRQQQSGSDGAWRPLSPFTIERQKSRARAKGKRRPRKMLGKLPTAFTVSITRESLKLVSRADWSMAHQGGASNAGRAPQIPKREFFWISNAALREFVRIIEEKAERSWWFR